MYRLSTDDSNLRNVSSISDGGIDEEVIPLCTAMNALPGVTTYESCSGHGKEPVIIFFRVSDGEQDGLFFLTRCVDVRYWQFGYKWNISLSVGDTYENGQRPTAFMLQSTDVGKEAYEQMDDLIENMNYHLNHKNFMSGFDLNISRFKLD